MNCLRPKHEEDSPSQEADDAPSSNSSTANSLDRGYQRGRPRGANPSQHTTRQTMSWPSRLRPAQRLPKTIRRRSRPNHSDDEDDRDTDRRLTTLLTLPFPFRQIARHVGLGSPLPIVRPSIVDHQSSDSLRPLDHDPLALQPDPTPPHTHHRATNGTVPLAADSSPRRHTQRHSWPDPRQHPVGIHWSSGQRRTPPTTDPPPSPPFNRMEHFLAGLQPIRHTIYTFPHIPDINPEQSPNAEHRHISALEEEDALAEAGWTDLHPTTSRQSHADSLHLTDEDDFEEAHGEDGDGEANDSAHDSQHQQRGDHHEDKAALPKADPNKILRAIQQEFGEVKQEEHFVSLASAVLVRTVFIRGSIILTNHRLAFVALLPSGETKHKSQSTNDDDGDDDAAAVAEKSAQEIIRQGPAVVHFPGWRRRRHAWFELRSDSIVAYRDSTTKYNPRGSGRLSEMEVKPFFYTPSGKPDPQTRKVYVSGRGGMYAFEFRTHEAANLWHKDLEAAVWACKKARDRVRVCVPIQRLVSVDTTEYRHFVNIKLGVLMDGDLKEHSSSRGPSAGAAQGEDGQVQLEFGVLRAQAHFVHDLEGAVNEAKKIHQTFSLSKVQQQVISPIIEIEATREKEEALRLAASHDDPEGLAAKLVELFTLKTPPADIKLIKAHLFKTFPLAGTLALSHEHLVFYRHRLPPFRDVRIKIPLADLVGVSDGKSLRPHHYVVKIQIRGHPSIAFEFSDRKQRDLVSEAMQCTVQEAREGKANVGSPSKPEDAPDASARADGRDDEELPDPIETLLEPVSIIPATRISHTALNKMPKMINMPSTENVTIEPMRIICLTIGSRGDVQPYIALCKALKERGGHRPCIVSHPEYKDWVEQHGIEFRGAGGDPGALMKLSVEHRLFSPAFFKESLGKFRAWLDELLRECYEQCWDAELLIESPSTMAGIHVAEAYQCYYFRAFTMPWTQTKFFPQAFSVPPVDLGEAYNVSSYALFDRVFWQATSGQINRWRRHMLGLAPTNFAELDQESVPFMYNFSSAVVPHPIDWSDNIAVTGYWFLSSSAEGWEAPEDLKNFIDKAKREDKKIAYIGFGSITVPDAEKTTHNIYEAVKAADVRAIVSKGWSDRMSKKDENKKEEQPPECVYVVDSIPHDWLFPQIDIAMHHGGAGTTGASLRAGLVTLIKPWFGDQFFWSGRIQKLGAGLKVPSLDIDDIAEALKTAAADRIMVEKAADVGARIRAEDGVGNAIAFISSHMASATRKHHPLKKKGPPSVKADNAVEGQGETEELDSSDDEEADGRDDAESLKRDMSLLEKVRAIGHGGSSSSARARSRSKKHSKSPGDSRDAIPEAIEDDGEEATPPAGDSGAHVLTAEPAEIGSGEDVRGQSQQDSSPETQPKKSSSFLSMPSLPHIPGIPNPHLPTLTNMHLIDAFKAYIPGFESDELNNDPSRKSSSDRVSSTPNSPARKSTLNSILPGALKRSDSSKTKNNKNRDGDSQSPTRSKTEKEEGDRKKYLSAKEEDKRRRELMEDKLQKRKEMLEEKRREREGYGEERERYLNESHYWGRGHN